MRMLEGSAEFISTFKMNTMWNRTCSHMLYTGKDDLYLYDENTGVLRFKETSEIMEHYVDGKLSRRDYKNKKSRIAKDKPTIIFWAIDIFTGETFKFLEVWCDKNGLTVLRPNGAPGVINYDSQGNIIDSYTSEPINEPKIKETDEYVLVYFDDDPDKVQYKNYKNKKERLANDLPTFIQYHKNGKLECEEWINAAGNYQRNNDKPAYITYRENGQVEETEKWYKNRKHSITGPYSVYYFEDGTISAHFAINNNKMSFETWAKRVKLSNDEKQQMIKKYDICI